MKLCMCSFCKDERIRSKVKGLLLLIDCRPIYHKNNKCYINTYLNDPCIYHPLIKIGNDYIPKEIYKKNKLNSYRIFNN